MSIKVSEITFDENLLGTKSLHDLKVDSISSSYLFFRVQQKYFLLLRAGDYIDASFKEKYYLKGVKEFFSLDITDNANIEQYHKLWNKLKDAKFEKEKKQVVEEMFLHLCKDYWSPNSELSFINFIISCYQQFYTLDKKVVQNLQSTSHVLYSRAIQVGTHATIAALASGYSDYEFIKDIFNTGFALDYGLVENEFNWNTIKACEFERNNPHLGKSSLKKILTSVKEYELFLDHPLKSAQVLIEHEKSFNYPEIIWAIKVHHEKVNGIGFPKGLNYSSISTWESVLQYADYVIPFEEKFYQINDGVDSIKNTFQTLFLSPHVKALPVFKVMQNIAKLFKWAENKIKEEDVA